MNLPTKKLLAVAPALAILSACSTTPIAKTDPLQVHQVLENTKIYKCDKSTDIAAVYGKDAVNLKVTAPSLNLNQSSLLLNQAVATDGVRYMTTTADKATSYNWGVKGSDAVLTVTHNGTDYTFICQAM